jgi:DNA-binding NtrC family response regulator/tetratricopeptide (TPR) repeat protein
MARPIDALLGESPQMAALRADLERLLKRQSGTSGRLPPILVLGETGTGKGLLARTIHEAGPRRAAPFVAVNCAAIPDTMAEAELFGYERGAFTDARQAKAGLFQAANGGTLFLDEIGLLPWALQGKLLTVIEDRAVRRLGSTRVEPVDLALVAATSLDLKRAIGEGQFREDLYHRLAVVTFELPPLRARAHDILQLADSFLARACADYGLPARVLTADARERLLSHRWPGNVRELGNVLERAVLMSVGDEITAAMLNLAVHEPTHAAQTDVPSAPGSLDDAMRARIESGLRASGGNIRQAAVALGISRNTLRARMDKYGLRQREVAASPPACTPPPDAGRAETPGWERRHVAFLRARLVAAPTIDVTRVLMEFAQKVQSFGGQVEDSSPTGLVAVFGLEPVDNAPSHAALAALAIHRMAARARATSATSSGPVDTVIAIDSGYHFVRQPGARFEIALDGKAALWSVLEELVAIHRPGATIVTDAVVPFLTRRFALERLPHPRRSAWVLLCPEVASAAWTPFVGRSMEIATILEAGALAARGQTQVVAVIAEAGVGKSRLLHEAAQQLQGWQLLEGSCAPYATKTSYFPFVEMLKGFCRIQDTDSVDEVREKIAQSLPPEAGDPEWLLPPLFDLIGALAVNDPLRAVDPALRRRRTHDALRQLFVAASTTRPLCLILEDLQWVDAATREVVDRLINSTVSARVLLLLSCRPEFQHAWSHKACYRQVRLEALPAENVAAFLDALLGADPSLVALKQLLVGRGNPFFLEETVRMLVESKSLEGPRGQYRLTRPVQALEVPATVRAILVARIDRLAPEDKRLLQIASALGKDVPFALLKLIAEVPEESLRSRLEALEAAEFIDETGLHPDLAYSFKHELTHSAAYSTLAEDERRALHARIVSAIEHAYPDRLAEQVERLSRHAVRGETWAAAASYLHQAGRKALARSANREAAEYFEKALEALGHCPETRETLQRAIDLRFDLKASLIPLGAFERIVAHLRDAEAAARRLDDPHRLGQFCVHMCQVLGLSGNPREAIRFGEDAQVLADSLGDVPLQVTATLFLGTACFSTLDYRRAERLFLKVLQLLEGEPSRERFGFAGMPAVTARAYLTRIAGDQGRFEQGTSCGQEGVRLAESQNHPYSLATVLWCLADLHITRGEFQQGVELLERGLSIAREWNLPFFAAGNAGSLGYAYAALGRAEQGLPLMQQALETFEAMGHRFALSLFLVPLGEACALADRPADALGHAERALKLARESGQRAGEAGAMRLLGDVMARQDAPADAERHYLDALALATALEMRPLAAHCHSGLGRLYRRTGRGEESCRHLATAQAMYREMGMNHWLASAETTDERATVGQGS